MIPDRVILTRGEICPHCRVAQLIQIKAREPYYNEHLQCPKCDSTYNIGEVVTLRVEEGVPRMPSKWVDITEFVKQFVPAGTIEEGTTLLLDVNCFKAMTEKAKKNKDHAATDGGLRARWKEKKQP